MNEVKSKENVPKEIKVLLFGNSGVGKTSIFTRFYNNKFDGNVNSSVGVDFQTKVIKHKNKEYSIHLFDTAGEERFRSVTTSYFHMADYFMLVFDLTNKNSLNAIPEWIESLKENVEKPKFMILGNKSDLERNQIQDDEINDVLEGKDNFKINGENFMKVSAKNGKNINEAFDYLLDLIEQNRNEFDEEPTIIRKKANKLINNKKKTGCC